MFWHSLLPYPILQRLVDDIAAMFWIDHQTEGAANNSEIILNPEGSLEFLTWTFEE